MYIQLRKRYLNPILIQSILDIFRKTPFTLPEIPVQKPAANAQDYRTVRKRIHKHLFLLVL